MLFVLFEQVLAYYISFLKTLSFKLNVHTIHFFYNEVSQYTTQLSWLTLDGLFTKLLFKLLQVRVNMQFWSIPEVLHSRGRGYSSLVLVGMSFCGIWK